MAAVFASNPGEAINSTLHISHNQAGAAERKAVEQPALRSDKGYNSPANEMSPNNKPERKSEAAEERSDPRKKTKLNKEKRDFEVEDGQFFARVYSGKGKLLRKIPPGYVPFNERRLNITA
jgi:hypothetical protein